MKKINFTLGFDAGNYNNKTQNTFVGSETNIFDEPSRLSSDFVGFNGKFYAPTTSRAKVVIDKTTLGDKMMADTLIGLANELEFQGLLEDGLYVNLALGAGLPPGNLDVYEQKYKDYYESYFKDGPIVFKFYKDASSSVTITVDLDIVKIYPQGVVSLFTNAANPGKPAPAVALLKDYPVWNLVDIGGGTLDIVTFNKGKIDADLSFSAPNFGTSNKLMGKISRRFNQMGRSIDEVQANAVVTGQKHSLPKEDVIIIGEELDKYADEVIDELEDQRIDLRTTPMAIAGGGALIIRKRILENPKINPENVYFVSGILSNAKGYARMVNAAKRFENI